MCGKVVKVRPNRQNVRFGANYLWEVKNKMLSSFRLLVCCNKCGGGNGDKTNFSFNVQLKDTSLYRQTMNNVSSFHYHYYVSSFHYYY